MDDLHETINRFIIDTDHPHATLFAEELSAHITGRVDYCKRDSCVAEHARAEQGNYLDWISGAILYRPDGSCPNTLYCSGSLLTHESKGEGRERSFPHYQSVAISFQRPLTSQEILQLRKRAQNFPANTIPWMGQTRGSTFSVRTLLSKR